MSETLTIQGRSLSPQGLQELRQWVGDNSHWSRWRLSRELATRWQWCNAAGQLKDMAARTRQDRHTCLRVPVKDIYLYALESRFREALCA